ncbi:MAG: PD-(D/E)XK nuclease family protein [Saccharofermentanales bacterium]
MLKKRVQIIAATDPIRLMDYCLSDLASIEKNMLAKLNERAFLIVPEALKADLERRYLENYDVDGLMLAEVLSFNRLAHRVFSIAGGLAIETISRLGKSLIIQRLIHDNPEKFKRFQRFAGMPGYSSELETVLSDFKRFDFDNSTLTELAELAPPSLTKDKLADFAVLQNLYQIKMQELELIDQDDNPDRLAELLQDAEWQPELDFLKNTRIWITGFADIRTFNQQELKIIKLLAERVQELKITICTDLSTSDSADSTDSIRRELFEPGYQSFLQLRKILPDAQLRILEEKNTPARRAIQKSFLTGLLELDESNHELLSDSEDSEYHEFLFDSEDSEHHELLQDDAENSEYHELLFDSEDSEHHELLQDDTENVLTQNKRSTKPEDQISEYDQFTLIAAEDKRQEWAFIAGEIKRLLTEYNYRKKDIGIVICDDIRDLSLEKSVLREFGLDTFLSERIPLRQTALFRYLSGFFELSTNDFKLNDLLAFLRSGLAEPPEDEIDQFENICLEFGLNNASKIQNDAAYAVIESDRKEWALSFKQKYLDPVFAALKTMRSLRRGAEKSKHLLTWLTQDLLTDKLQKMIDQLRDSGEEDIALSLARSWELMIQLLEESITLLGESQISQKGFKEVILGTLSGQTPSSIPVGLDRIRVGSPREMIYYDCKILFITGAVRDKFPQINVKEGFLHQIEINWIELNSEKKLPDYKKNGILSNQVTAILNLTAAQDRIYLSVPDLDEAQWPAIFVLLQNELMNNYGQKKDTGSPEDISPEDISPEDIKTIYGPDPDEKSLLAKRINLNAIILGETSDPDQRWLTAARTKRYLMTQQRVNNTDRQDTLQKTEISADPESDLRLPSLKIFWQKALAKVSNQDTVQTSSADLATDSLDLIKPYISLDRKLLKQVFAQNNYTAASGLEKFQACPYQYFADYTLVLHERPLWDADPRDRGTLIHSMMEIALRTLEQKLSAIPDLTTRKKEFEKWLDLIKSDSFYNQLYQQSVKATGAVTYQDGAIIAAQGRRIKRHVRAALWYNATIINPDGYFPRFFEWTFPPRKQSSTYRELELSAEKPQIFLRGVIDRIDLNDSGQYRLYDYKTGGKKIDPERIHSGLDLQLGLYQKIWQINHPDQTADRIAYLNFNNTPKDVHNAKQLFIPPQQELVQRLNSNNPIQEIKAEDPQELNELGEQALQHAKTAVKKIRQGQISPIPKTVAKDSLPCDYCPFKEMCRYDQRLIEKRAEYL